MLIDWTKDVAEKLGMHQGSLHLAVRLIDLFMDGHDIQVFLLVINAEFTLFLFRTLSCIWFAWVHYF